MSDAWGRWGGGGRCQGSPARKHHAEGGKRREGREATHLHRVGCVKEVVHALLHARVPQHARGAQRLGLAGDEPDLQRVRRHVQHERQPPACKAGGGRHAAVSMPTSARVPVAPLPIAHSVPPRRAPSENMHSSAAHEANNSLMSTEKVGLAFVARISCIIASAAAHAAGCVNAQNRSTTSHGWRQAP